MKNVYSSHAISFIFARNPVGSMFMLSMLLKMCACSANTRDMVSLVFVVCVCHEMWKLWGNTAHTTAPKSQESACHPLRIPLSWVSWKFYWYCSRCGRSSCFCFVIPIVTRSDNELIWTQHAVGMLAQNQHPPMIESHWQITIHIPSQRLSQQTTLAHTTQPLLRIVWVGPSQHSTAQHTTKQPSDTNFSLSFNSSVSMNFQ